MSGLKPWYLSKTIWASIITIATSLGALFGIPATLIDNAALADTIIQLITALMGAAAIFGRVTAGQKIR